MSNPQGQHEEPRSAGLRERKQAATLTSIKRAARELFTAHGYQATPIREVARVADVGFGTVSAYAVDKAGLAAMLFVDDLRDLPPVFHDIDADLPLIDQLLTGFARLFRIWARNPDLSRAVLPQLETRRSNPHVEPILQRRRAIIDEISAWLRAAQAAGRVERSIDPAQAAETLFALYTSTVREWLLTEPLDTEAGPARLRYLFAIPVAALVARERPDAASDGE
jgi:AcrR family transcriptional regulator